MTVCIKRLSIDADIFALVKTIANILVMGTSVET